MSAELGTFYDRLSITVPCGNSTGGDLSPREIEAYATGVAEVLALVGIELCAKSYDPLRIDEEEKIAHTYAFDLWDGGRHHPYESLEQVVQGIRKEAVENLREDGIAVNERFAEFLTGELAERDVQG